MQISLNANNKKDPREVKKCTTTLRNAFTGLTVFLLFAVLLYVCKTYTNHILKWLENQDTAIIYLVILMMFIIVSFPIVIGYMGMVITTGYLFGILTGLILSVCGAAIGLSIAHNSLKRFGHTTLRPLVTNETAAMIFKVISGPSSFRIVLCARLTPIPFGLQNTIFAISSVSDRTLYIASVLGLLPGQTVGVYTGSSLRSMRDVLENHEISTLTWCSRSDFWFGWGRRRAKNLPKQFPRLIIPNLFMI
ncbi:transmembrane protein 64 isoform X2 [Photinus pyralis]|uniref:transmembrane protein 64 isoform X2 n=1 Tax=Photinus pyralis TaxID=7054 RepID=UPI001266EA00|nr:transmembrane protein 64 isoform X2 [Photinus pyralis]